MSDYVKKFNLVSQIVCEILHFKESCILIILEVFGPCLRRQIFPRHVVLSYSSKKKYKLIDKILVKNSKAFCWDNYLEFLRHPSNLSGLFLQNSGLVTFLTWELSIFMQIIRKTDESTLRSCTASERTDWQIQPYS